MTIRPTGMPPSGGTPRPWLGASRLAERRAADPVLNAQEIPIAQMRTDDGNARAWRVTLSRVDRRDVAAPLAPNDPGNSSPLWVSKLFQYTAGTQNTPAIPPRRSNPVFGPGGSGSDIEPLWVEIAWGMRDAAPNRILANWPMLGASIVLVGSYVEVFAGAAVFSRGNPQVVEDGMYPVFEAMIAPAEGVAVEDAAELSINHRAGVEDLTPGVDSVFATDTDFDGAFQIGVTNGILNEAWTAVLNAGFTVGRTISVTFEDTGAAGVEVRTDERYAIGGGVYPAGWSAAPGNIGVRVTYDGAAIPVSLGAPTVDALEDAIQATAGSLATFTTRDLPHALFNLDPAAIPNIDVARDGYNGTFSEGSCATQGAAVYVPDFARRVRVTLTQVDTRFCGNENRVPATGNPKSQLVWYDDLGNVVDSLLQCCPEFHPVPDRATMLGIYAAETGQSYTAMVHWRIAP